MGMIDKHLLLFNMCPPLTSTTVYLISGQTIIEINRLGPLNHHYQLYKKKKIKFINWSVNLKVKVMLLIFCF